MKELELLQEKIGLLLEKSTLLKEENKRLHEALQAKQNAEQQLQTELANANTAAEQDNQQLRDQVDAAIGELDKILSLIDEQ